MIGIDINGGLGNQLFQYATAFAVSKIKNDAIRLNISSFDLQLQKQLKLTIREFQLDKFDLNPECDCFSIKYSNNLFSKFFARIRRIKSIGQLYNTKFYKEENPYQFEEDIYSYGKNEYLCGYFQSWKYFDKYNNELKNQFRIKDEYISDYAKKICQQCMNQNSVAIHIRRGDYLHSADWLIDEKFYLDALREIEGKVNKENLILYIFCDQEGFAENLFSEYKNIVYITALNKCSDVEEFWIMKSCRNHVISNSSFSWWAAYLCEYEDQIVYAPTYKQWSEEYYLPNWNKMNAVSGKTFGE